MSSFWTEDTITTVQRTFIKGAFTGKYYAEHREDWSQPHSEFYHMHIYQAEVTLTEVRRDCEGDFPEVTGLRSFKGTFGQPVSCYDPGSGNYFQLNLDEPRIADPVLSKIAREGTEHMGTISGTIYGYVSKLITEHVRIEHQLPDAVTVLPKLPDDTADWNPRITSGNTPSMKTGRGSGNRPFSADKQIVGDGVGWTRTVRHEFSRIRGLRYRRDYYRHGNGCYKWGDWYLTDDGWSFIAIMKMVLGLCFSGLLLAFLISLSWPGFIILGIVLLLIILSSIRRSGFETTFFSLFYGLLILFYLSGIAVSIFRGLNTQHPVINPKDQTNRRDFTRTQPVKQKSDVTDGGDSRGDEWIIHHRAWMDLDGHQYTGDVRVLRSAYQQSMDENARLTGISGLSDVYKAMTLADRSRLGGVYPLFDSLRRVNRLDSLQFAQMLVGFVQDIPYTTVTEGLCGSVPDNALSGLSGQAGQNCIGYIPYGVQSPVEFMANLEGDCDTRTLFLFTLFNHYAYHVAILGSTAFRHSLLGLSLPLPGSAKMAGPERYILWETTSRGFAAGHLSPEIDHMDYWDFYLINTPSL